ncbi:MAG TPA: SpoIIE family protein phosphatase [Candidatus Acidoferrales bacterium]
MASPPTNRIRAIWAGMSVADWVALAILLLYSSLFELRESYPQIPRLGFLLFLAVCAGIYWLVRGWIWARDNLLWSLRNRLMTAYVFIAVVPVLLLLAMAGLAAYLLYWQLGAYVIHTEMEDREVRVGVVATAMATAYAAEATLGSQAAALTLPVAPETYIKNAMTELPGLKIETGTQEVLLRTSGSSGRNRYRGLVFSDGQLALRAEVTRPSPTGPIVVSAYVPVTPDLIETLAPELGPIEFRVLRPGTGSNKPGLPIVISTRRYMLEQEIETTGRSIPKAVNIFDKLITGVVGLEVLDLDQKPEQTEPVRVIVSFSTRPSLLNQRLFSPLGDLGSAAGTALLVVGAIFLVIEFGSLVTGIVMTRTITTAVDSLYNATQHVQEGDLTFRVRIPHNDQLAALGDSFNSMTQSVSTLIEEQGKRQKLENELSFAHEVQQQLFPHSLPNMPGIEIEAIVRPARVVSGDYYDFIRISPTRMAIALADISGKGISAALLMANVQAALRSDVLRYRNGQSRTHHEERHEEIDTSEIVSHLNHHLFRNTTDERYATFFFAVYDSETRQLFYTNAGHLPPIYMCGSRIRRLETGGMVVGLFNDVPFEQGAIEIEHGGLLIAYSDGLIEAENAYGEEFGTDRLIEVASRCRDASSHDIAEAMMHAVDEWSGSPEQADDMTVVVMRFSRSAQETRS